ncbi:MAG: hypothetical protein MN733_33550, partial [Nitrososphaera sp.]|nr:hypothetical protein [Nitrososphaera sp.]
MWGSDRLFLALGSVLLALSGMSALIYQTCWLRLFQLSIGSTSASIATVLVAFFSGMSVGSVLSKRFRGNVRQILKIYACVELLIGISGVITLPLLLHLDRLFALLGSLGTLTAIRFGIAILALAIPTLSMGLTFPILVRVYATDLEVRQKTIRCATFYLWNTCGAAVGAILSGFVLMPLGGIDVALAVACGANGGAALIALLACKRWELKTNCGGGVNQRELLFQLPTDVPRNLLGIILWFTGVGFLATEVGWTKYLSMLTGTTIFGFSIIVASALYGVAVGSWLWQTRLNRIVRHPMEWLGAMLLAAGVALLLTRYLLCYAVELNQWLSLDSSSILGLVGRSAFVGGVVIVPCALFGAIFPLSLTLYSHAGGDVGQGYAINMVGGILGSIVAGLIVIPHFGTDTVLYGTAVGTIAIALVSLLRTGSRSIMLPSSIGILCLVWSSLVAGPDFAGMAASAYEVYSGRPLGELDVLTCSWCGGKRKLIALITDGAVVRKILEHLGL